MQVQRNQNIQSLIELLKLTAHNHSLNVNSMEKSFLAQLKEENLSEAHLLGQINVLSRSYETILLDIAICLQTLKIKEVSLVFLKIFHQMVAIIKWALKRFVKNKRGEQLNNLQSSYRNMLATASDQKQHLKTANQFYKMKQTCQFFTHQIDDELTKMKAQEQFSYSDLNAKRGKLQQIKPTQRELILVQAVETIATQSQMFKLFIQNTNQKFMQDVKQMNIVAYPKLRQDIDKCMLKKTSQVNKDFSVILKKFFKTLEQQQKKKKKVSFQTVQIQTDKDEMQEKIHKKNKTQQEEIKSLNLRISYYTDRVQKMQKMVKQKSNYFQKQLHKAKVEHRQTSELDNLRKSVHQLNSIKTFNQPFEADQQKVSFGDVFKKAGNKIQIREKKKKNLKRNRSKSPEKKIRFLQSEKLSHQLVEDDATHKFGNDISKSSISISEFKDNNTFEFQIYNILYEFADRKQNKKETKNSICNIHSNIINYQYIFPLNHHLRQRKQSLIIIRGMPNHSMKQSIRQTSKNSGKVSQDIISSKRNIISNSKQSSDQANYSSAFRFLRRQSEKVKIQGNQKERNTQLSYVPGNDLQDITNEQHNQNYKKIIPPENQIFFIKSSKMKSDGYKHNKRIVQNVFEQINFNENRQQIKSKTLRNYSKGIQTLSQNRYSLKQKLIFSKNDMINLFFAEDIAMETEISFGVSTPVLLLNLQDHPENYLYREIEPLLFSWSKNRVSDLNILKKFLRYPYTSINSNKRVNIQNITINKLKDILTHIITLHSDCNKNTNQKMCQHIQEFMKKVTGRQN